MPTGPKIAAYLGSLGGVGLALERDRLGALPAHAFVYPGRFRSEVSMAKQLFLSYALIDGAHGEALATQLAPLVRANEIEIVDDTDIPPGVDWRAARSSQIALADAVVLLVSPDFLASEDLWNGDVERALSGAKEGGAIVVPVILRPCMWQTTVLASYRPLPRGGAPITKNADGDGAWLAVAEALRAILATPKSMGASTDEPSSAVDPESVVPAVPRRADHARPRTAVRWAFLGAGLVGVAAVLIASVAGAPFAALVFAPSALASASAPTIPVVSLPTAVYSTAPSMEEDTGHASSSARVPSTQPSGAELPTGTRPRRLPTVPSTSPQPSTPVQPAASTNFPELKPGD